MIKARSADVNMHTEVGYRGYGPPYLIRRHGSDVYLGMCPIKMATPILMYYGASAKLAKRRRRRTIEGYG